MDNLHMPPPAKEQLSLAPADGRWGTRGRCGEFASEQVHAPGRRLLTAHEGHWLASTGALKGTGAAESAMLPDNEIGTPAGDTARVAGGMRARARRLRPGAP